MLIREFQTLTNGIFLRFTFLAAKDAVPLQPKNGTSHEQHGFRY